MAVSHYVTFRDDGSNLADCKCGWSGVPNTLRVSSPAQRLSLCPRQEALHVDLEFRMLLRAHRQGNRNAAKMARAIQGKPRPKKSRARR
jgi:hypothetical protein